MDLRLGEMGIMKKMAPRNVIDLNQKISEKESAKAKKKKIKPKPATRVIAITSGKGGVGKTNIVANLGYALAKLGKKVLIWDADLGLANLDILLGIAPKYNLSHVIKGEKTIQEITVECPGNMKILPASSGIQELTRITREQKIRIVTELDMLVDSTDILLIDTAAGISSNVMYFNTIAQEIIVVVSPEPTSITDAYALMKILSMKYSEHHFKMVVNMAGDTREAYEVFRQLNLVSDRFLNISIDYIGYIAFDDLVSKSIKSQTLVSQAYPDSKASECYNKLAKTISASPSNMIPEGGSNFFWNHLGLETLDKFDDI